MIRAYALIVAADNHINDVIVKLRVKAGGEQYKLGLKQLRERYNC